MNLHLSRQHTLIDKARAFPPLITCEWFDIRWCSCIRHPGSIIISTSARAVLGSVSDYCAHRAHCMVTIVKKPKTKY
ncbi:hypothetical protein ACET3Z_000969 [Daucus carota]